MTTIILCEAADRNNGRYQVFGLYNGTDDMFIFAVQDFDSKSAAERYAASLMTLYATDYLRRVRA